ncbi:sigma-70 family RNA polymerase sigma factor [Tunicatimonas pelagia]|uniref:sigma-70 family RNA polymerase sigma factor n=1 Tax=Tunicatimonas pelagia TaxID=931531 RepID=UPI0026666DCD|nr:sigma-70 family RNA polymerase sigma factor [Tunicatimonas pelagia]WKN42975.1 sigma-70 family RNA polymerase sigma factor [Tunicatimonas pelagia]
MSLLFRKKPKPSEPDISTPEGLEQIYQRCFDTMYEIGYAQTKDTEITRELIQELFISAWEKRDTLVAKEKVEYYLLRLFKYRLIDHFRKEARQRHHHQQATLDYCDASHCTEQEIAYAELKDNVDTLVDRLPCQCRRVYRMSREQGLSNKEIASSLLISERAVAYHLAKATTFLREKLPDYTRAQP